MSGQLVAEGEHVVGRWGGRHAYGDIFCAATQLLPGAVTPSICGATRPSVARYSRSALCLSTSRKRRERIVRLPCGGRFLHSVDGHLADALAWCIGRELAEIRFADVDERGVVAPLEVDVLGIEPAIHDRGNSVGLTQRRYGSQLTIHKQLHQLDLTRHPEVASQLMVNGFQIEPMAGGTGSARHFGNVRRQDLTASCDDALDMESPIPPDAPITIASFPVRNATPIPWVGDFDLAGFV